MEDNLFNNATNYLVSTLFLYRFKGRVECFSMQFVMNKCFFLNPEKKKKKNWRRSVFSFSRKTHTWIPKNDVTEM